MLPCVKTSSESILKPLYPGDKVRLGSAEDGVVVIIHQDPAENLPTGPATGFCKGVVKEFPVPVIEDDWFAPTPSRDQRLTKSEAIPRRLHRSQSLSPSRGKLRSRIRREECGAWRKIRVVRRFFSFSVKFSEAEFCNQSSSSTGTQFIFHLRASHQRREALGANEVVGATTVFAGMPSLGGGGDVELA